MHVRLATKLPAAVSRVMTAPYARLAFSIIASSGIQKWLTKQSTCCRCIEDPCVADQANYLLPVQQAFMCG